MRVCTYICIVIRMKLEQAIQTQGFASQKQKAGVNIMFTAYMVKTRVTQCLKPFDLTPEQFNVMRILKGKHPEQMCVKDIASRVIERSSNIPRIIDRLVTKNWVQRATSAVDKRETVMSITQEGMEVLQQASTALDQAHLLSTGLSDEELTQLNELLDRYRG